MTSYPKVTGMNTSCERSSDRVWSAKATMPHDSLVQSMFGDTALASSVTENTPPSPNGIGNPAAYPGGFDEIQIDCGEEPSMLMPPTHLRPSTCGWLHTAT